MSLLCLSIFGVDPFTELKKTGLEKGEHAKISLNNNLSNKRVSLISFEKPPFLLFNMKKSNCFFLYHGDEFFISLIL